MLKKLKKALKSLLGVDERHKVIVKIEPKSEKSEEKKKKRPVKESSPRKEREKSKNSKTNRSNFNAQSRA